ncbi:MAG: RNA polymerase sigma factor [Neomegalonema sp.]|nr:RNA polymerase sigma factor [Neomegalonema sp.]
MPDPRARSLEEYLVAAARLGDRAAAERLVRLRGPRLLSHAARLLSNPDEARDVVQEAWLEIFRGLPGLRDERAFPAWSHRIVTRRVAKHIAAAQRRRKAADATAETTEPFAAEEGALSADAEAVRRAIKALPPDHQAAISLFYLDEMSVAEVAIALDTPPGTIKTRLMHARAKLAQALKGSCDE